MNMHMLTEIAGGYVSAISRFSSDSTLVYILIISILLTELMVVVIVLLCKIKRQADEREDYNVGYRDNDASQNAVDARLLDKETIQEAISLMGILLTFMTIVLNSHIEAIITSFRLIDCQLLQW